MTAPPVHMEFAPPPTPGLWRALALAIAAHLLLLLVLALGVQWKRDAPPVVVEAELWSAVPKQAAPPPQPPVPAVPVPPPVKQVVEPPPVPKVPLVDPNIAIAQEKARQQHEKERQLRLAELEKEKHQREALKIQKQKEEQAAREKEQHEKLAREKQLQQEQQKAQAAKNESKAKELAEIRKQQIERMNRMASQTAGNGDANSAGSAKQSSGPSASYAGRIVARIKPNITYTESLNSNPAAEVEVRTSPDGTIISRKLVKSSGVKSWDDAVINAIDKTEKLPPDVDGRVIPALTLNFRPKD
jgi:colicin import membrane protein